MTFLGIGSAHHTDWKDALPVISHTKNSTVVIGDKTNLHSS